MREQRPVRASDCRNVCALPGRFAAYFLSMGIFRLGVQLHRLTACSIKKQRQLRIHKFRSGTTQRRSIGTFAACLLVRATCQSTKNDMHDFKFKGLLWFACLYTQCDAKVAQPYSMFVAWLGLRM